MSVDYILMFSEDVSHIEFNFDEQRVPMSPKFKCQPAQGCLNNIEEYIFHI